MNESLCASSHPPSRSLPIGLSSGLLTELDIVADWGLLATDRDLKITHFNPWMERHAQRPAEAYLGRPLLDLFPSLISRKHDDRYRQALDGRSSVLSQRLHKYLLPLAPPTPRARFEFMQQTCRIIPLVDGAEIHGTLTIIEDVTERVAYELELRERVSALREADRHKDEFLAMLAHELRNPLAPISHALQILQIGDNDANMRSGARQIIQRQVAQLVRLVDDLLDVSRVSCGKIQLQRLRIDLCAVARQAVETSRPLIESRRHHFELLLPDQVIPVDGDFVRLAQLISNLLNNAAKYTDVEGQISLSIETTASGTNPRPEAIVRVRDNGRGIDSTARDRLFSLFFQADRNLDRSEGGLGIGLALVRSLAELHGGSVEVDSAGRGMGSEFSLRLPLQTTVSVEPLPPSASVPAIRPTRILVVDDNRDSVESMALLLRADGHQVLTSHDAHEAIEIALRERPTAVLLDIGLPGLTGYEVCTTLRAAGLHDACIIAMSGYPPSSQHGGASGSRFDAHLVKPIDYDTLKNLLTRHEARPRTGGPR